MSEFILRIDRYDRLPVRLRPGGRYERDLVEEVTERAVAEGVGYFRSEAQVRAAIRKAFQAVLLDAKGDVAPL